MGVAGFDNEEIDALCLALDANGSSCPVDGAAWVTAWTDGVISAAQVIQAAREDLRFEDE